MLVLDETAQIKRRNAEVREAELQRLADNLKREREAARLLIDPDKTATEELGSWMTPAELERKLLKINPNFIFVKGKPNSMGKVFKGVWFMLPNGGLVGPEGSITVYPDEPMPEFSIMNTRTVEVPDATTAVDAKSMIAPGDLPKHEWVPHGKDPRNGYWVVPGGEALPGMERIERPWDERRGWRTVLMRLWQSGYITLDQVIKEFGPANRRSWAALTGTHNIEQVI